MNKDHRARIKAFLNEEYTAARAASQGGNPEQAWNHLERAHIIAQSKLGPHLFSHWKMLGLAVRSGDAREVVGQIMRLLLAPLGNLTGRLPIGNTGRSNVSAFTHMQIPADLQAILETPSN
ncbi:MAG: DUF3703 domain-containing protein [Pseudomonadota bacterium]